jgi:hypothetical protein
MTCEPIDAEHWRVSFSELESDFLLATLARMGRHYQEDISRMPPALRAYWQGTITRGEAGSKDELRALQDDLAEARTELRAERIELIENLMREYELSEQHEPWIVELTAAERDDFIAMLNDRRMTLAGELGITEDDMESDLAQVSSEARRAGIWEIDVLGRFILVMIGRQIYRP